MPKLNLNLVSFQLAFQSRARHLQAEHHHLTDPVDPQNSRRLEHLHPTRRAHAKDKVRPMPALLPRHQGASSARERYAYRYIPARSMASARYSNLTKGRRFPGDSFATLPS